MALGYKKKKRKKRRGVKRVKGNVPRIREVVNYSGLSFVIKSKISILVIDTP